jgi:hypothetical protein
MRLKLKRQKQKGHFCTLSGWKEKRRKEKATIDDNLTTIRCHVPYHEEEDMATLPNTNEMIYLGIGWCRMSRSNDTNITHFLASNEFAPPVFLNKKINVKIVKHPMALIITKNSCCI